MEQKRWLLQFDLLRIIAALSVVCLHASAHIWYYAPIHSSSWVITNCFNVASRIGVPLFVMISGAMFLDPSRIISVKDLWLHHILRLAIVYALWSCIYGALHYFGDASSFSLKDMIKCMLEGNYHLWFLPMIIGIYALVPILRKWTVIASKKELNYFLLLFLIFQILRITLRSVLKTKEVISLMDSADFDLICGYVGYFILGYYLYHVRIEKKWNVIFYVLALPCFALNVLVSTLLTWRENTPQSDFSDSYCIFTFVLIVAIFQWITQKTFLSKPEDKLAKLLKETARSTFGVYLIHLIIMETPWIIPLYSILPPMIAIPVITVISFVAGLLIATVLRKIPFVGKYVC